jgi:hypothetical protein
MLSAASTLWRRRIQSLIIATMRRTLDVEVCHDDGAGACWSMGEVGTSSGWLVTGTNGEKASNGWPHSDLGGYGQA